MTDPIDARFMGLALALGERHLGLTAPNPSVGCVIVRDGLVVGRGWTQPGGRPHAEAEALARAGVAAQGATAYVTLEPCSNWGKTPPCTKGLIEAGIARVVVGCVDPDPRVDGKGIADEAPAPDAPLDYVPRLTNDMAARIQGFDSEWHFSGRKTSVYRQIGNAFPPPVARAIGESIAEAMGAFVSRTTRTGTSLRAVS